jgi:hypothetical protein
MEITVPGIGDVALDITRGSAQFGRNAIPQANFAIALGSAVPNTALTSNIHFIVDKIVYRTKAKVWAQITNGYEALPPGLQINEDDAFNGKPFLLFEGYTSGSGYRKSGSGLEYIISMEHWLSDLNNSTALSPDLQPGTPFNMYFPATGTTGEVSQSAIGIHTTLADKLINAEEIIQDMWENIKKYFIAIAGTNTISMEQLAVLTLKDQSLIPNIFKSAKNNAALAAFARFASPGAADYPVIKFRKTASTPIIGQNIVNVLKSKTLVTFDGTTFWDNLVGFAASFMFQIIPGITRAWVAPVLNNYYRPYKTVYATEVVSYDITTAMPKFVSGAALKVAMSTGSGLVNAINGVPEEGNGREFEWLNSAVYLSSRHEKSPGMIVIQRAPDWLSAGLPSERFDGQQGTMARAVAEVKDKAKNFNLREKAEGYLQIATAYAKVVYSNEVLKHRNGSITGKFRLDIAPGATVKVETAGENRLNKDAFDYPVYAMVDQVSFSIDAIASQATTSFTLSNIRSEIENKDADITSVSNPLYDTVWLGSPLHTG